jgi:hypothetical protein
MYDSFVSYTKLVNESQTLNFIEETHSLLLSSEAGLDLSKMKPGDVIKNIPNIRYLDLDTKTPKAVLLYSDAFYPYIMFYLGQVIAFYSKAENRNVELIAISIWNSSKDQKNTSILGDFIKKIISDYGVTVKLYSKNDYDSIKVSNFYLLDNVIQTIYPEIVYNEVQKYVFGNKGPNKKVFVSRKIRHQHADGHDIRISNDDLVEDVFKNLGFEIVYPETFQNFIDQINYFSNVKILAGVTGAGLTNSVFMPPGGTVIELSTILNLSLGSDTIFSEVHEYYKMISLFKKHLYFSISNVSGKAEDFINNKDAIDMIRKISSD